MGKVRVGFFFRFTEEQIENIKRGKRGLGIREIRGDKRRLEQSSKKGSNDHWFTKISFSATQQLSSHPRRLRRGNFGINGPCPFLWCLYT